MPHNAQLVRGVAQPGSALAWGARGREFESRRPDHEIPGKGDVPIRFVSFFYFSVPAENYFGERMHSDGNDTEEDRQIHRHCEKELVSLDRDVGHFAHQKKGKIATNPNLNGQHDQYRQNSVLAENDYPHGNSSFQRRFPLIQDKPRVQPDVNGCSHEEPHGK